MNPNDDDPLRYWSQRSAIRGAAEDEVAKNSRRRLSRALVGAFERTSQSLLTTGHIFGSNRIDGTSPFGNGDDGLVALGHLSSTASSLILGTVELLDQHNCYAASALNRQLVEVEYLGWAFAEDHDEAASWLRSTRQERLERWQPRHLRDRSRGKFRGLDYAEHCEIGGHPSPQGIRVLTSGRKAETIELILTEACFHGVSTWEYLVEAVSAWCADQSLRESMVPPSIADTVTAAKQTWDTHDHLASTWMAIRDG